jgi:hypothetical protein
LFCYHENTGAKGGTKGILIEKTINGGYQNLENPIFCLRCHTNRSSPFGNNKQIIYFSSSPTKRDFFVIHGFAGAFHFLPIYF